MRHFLFRVPFLLKVDELSNVLESSKVIYIKE